MEVTVTTTPPAEPGIESVTLVLSLDEALYILAELAGGNDNVHPGKSNDVFSKLSKALGADCSSNGAVRERYEKQAAVARTLRPSYRYDAARLKALDLGLDLNH